ncbi:Uma2 family endonuclease [Gloeobacter morelensis]|uniref:Uma2 family endonuclease n=1 Tax=Gloeobacter morelensis MG652769 TaxID=2781736 RepID=A0ABY3PLZ2_9CYAN|nr:Uma2 family endonuclease [Gloeobacter morelensis]UFP94417.1 Uma2 family endonuclease [Gloeobacter morelensis MG652769]
MFQYNPAEPLPTVEQLPDSDGKPVDNELQVEVAGLLSAILSLAWAGRTDWFFGANLGLYYAPDEEPVVPDGFLSLGVQRHKGEHGRPSYVVWEEGALPVLVLEIVSRTYRGEYGSKLTLYQQLAIPYYVIYNPMRRRQQSPFAAYRLVDGNYHRQEAEPFWMQEVGLGLGRGEGTYKGWQREWLYWFNQDGRRLSTPEEQMEQERAKIAALERRLRQLGEDPVGL